MPPRAWMKDPRRPGNRGRSARPWSKRRPNRAGGRRRRAPRPRPATRPKPCGVLVEGGDRQRIPEALARMIGLTQVLEQRGDGGVFQPLALEAPHRHHPRPGHQHRRALAQAQHLIAHQRRYHVQRTRQPTGLSRARLPSDAIISISMPVAKYQLVVRCRFFSGNPGSGCSSPSARAGHCRPSRRLRGRKRNRRGRPAWACVSSTATRKPASASATPALRPAKPPPITTTSRGSGITVRSTSGTPQPPAGPGAANQKHLVRSGQPEPSIHHTIARLHNSAQQRGVNQPHRLRGEQAGAILRGQGQFGFVVKFPSPSCLEFHQPFEPFAVLTRQQLLFLYSETFQVFERQVDARRAPRPRARRG